MRANAISLLGIFEPKIRLEIPIFQRQYVWGRTQQWEPLWEDIERKFTDYLEGRIEAPVHFLGAIVLDQKLTPTGHVERRQVIDGQQRLTTLQIFLAAFRDFCREQEVVDLANECLPFTLNRGMMADPDVDKFKVWPTRLDQPQFSDVMSAGSRAELETRHPLKRRKYARKPDPRPRMVEAYLYFYDAITEFSLGSNGEKPLAAEYPLEERLEECFRALKNSLQVVAIDLEEKDDPQVIFETLNARGEPLLPADLLRNYIFLRAARRGEPQESLYEEFWQDFDEEFWRVKIKQGRLKRPRSDLFVQHFLASRRTVDIPVRHLFVEYKYWIEQKEPFDSVREELSTLSRQGADFRRIIAPKKDDPLYDLATFLQTFDIRTVHPLLLMLLDVGIDESQWPVISTILESYLVRRAVCGLTTKNYNRIFLALTRNLSEQGPSATKLAFLLAEQTGESSEWPTDEAFSEAWRTQHAYRMLNNPRIVHILRRINDTYLVKKMEKLQIEGSLTVEHIMPQKWLQHWPLPDGSTGMNQDELWESAALEPRAIATRTRNAAVQTFGNLTILTNSLNPALSNSSWPVKKPELLRHSLLPINQNLHDVDDWDEKAIARRGEELLKRALQIWPRP